MNIKDELAKIINVAHRTLFDATDGRVGGSVAGMRAVALTTTGRKTGKKRTSMLTTPIYDDKKVVLIASYGGDERHPMWYRNLLANPDVELVGMGERRRMKARTASPDERAELWPQVTAKYSGYANYQTKTDREIPVVILEPAV